MRLLTGLASLVTGFNWKNREHLLRLGGVVAVIGIMVAASLLLRRLSFADVGYVGVALASLVASASLIVPVPALAAVCSASPFLNPLLVGLIAGSGETLGELTGYVLGASGSGFINKRRLYLKLEGWLRRRGWLLLFLISVIPNPIFDIVGVAAGALRYPLWRFLAVVWVGKVTKFIAFAYACVYSIEWIVDIF